MHLFYDETKDQSEKFGWKKVCDEHVPTEEEQIHWGNLTIAFACILSLIAISLGWARHGFDRVKSRQADNTRVDGRNQRKLVTANAANDEVFALAA